MGVYRGDLGFVGYLISEGVLRGRGGRDSRSIGGSCDRVGGLV